MAKSGKRRRREAATLLLDCLLIFILAGYLVRPLFKAKYLDRWESIESTFIADARFLKEHWPHPQWQPLWYCGTRFDYIYPPALRYGAAVLARIWLPVKAYHIYTAFFYCAGIAGVYLFIRIFSGSRGAGWLGAAATASLSPSFLFLQAMRHAAGPDRVPQRLGVLVRYGEGPHMTALALLPIALACAFPALRRNSPLALAGAAVFCALVVSNNFYGATALAVLYAILVWSVWITHQPLTAGQSAVYRARNLGPRPSGPGLGQASGAAREIWLRAAAVAALAYGLTAFWLVPSYFRITAENMKFVSARGNTWSLWLAVAAAVGFALGTGKLARGKPQLAYVVFLAGSVLFFAVNVLGHFYFNFRVVGEPGRLVPELDLVMILAAVEGLRRLWQWRLAAPPRGRVAVSVGVAAIVLLSFSTALRYWKHRWTLYPLAADYRQRVEYRITEWMAHNLPKARALAAGSVRFWYDAWQDLPQVGGGAEQGVLNGTVMPAQREILAGDNPELAIQWMLCLGVDAVIVHDKNSQEVYHDFQYPRKFAGILPVLYDNHAGDVIYQVRRRFPGLARVVERGRLASLRPIRSPSDLEGLRTYAGVVEKGPDSPAPAVWKGTDVMRIHARVNQGQAVLVQASYDPAWHAYSGAKLLPVWKDIMGFMVIDAPPGEHDFDLVFELPLENLAGRIVTVVSLGIVVGLLVVGWRRRELEQWFGSAPASGATR